MRSDIDEYEAVEKAAQKFVKSVAEGTANTQENYLLMKQYSLDI